ncbi:TonB-dependent siderophore receptor [Halotalea alkalilenta]|uniref:TonB-dependent siderophore receptor n=1 Tax=Halotalea alkalilenta TaxID=376489 RepID=UPI0004888988|nr:TonB-dependent siderophore receptor [Halotalea alkalilenta]
MNHPPKGSSQPNNKNRLKDRSKRPHHWIALCSSSAAIFLSSHALAQVAGSSETLDTLTVEAARQSAVGPDRTIVADSTATGSKTDTPLLDLSAAVSVITEPEMRKRSVQNLQEILAYTSSVSVDEYGSDDRYDFYRIRGFSQTSLGTYRDGLSVRTANFTSSRVEPYGLQRVEVLKGSTSTLFGLNSPGGIVNTITKRPQEQKFGEVYTTLGDGHTETGTDFGGPIDANREWTYRITTKWQDGDNGVDHARDDRFYFAPALTWRPSDATSLTLLAGYNKRKGNTSRSIPYGSGIDPETFLGEPDFDKMDTIERNIGYQFEHSFGNGLTFRQNTRYTNLDLLYETVYPGAADPSEERTAFAVHGERNLFTIDNQLQYDTQVAGVGSRTLAGFDYFNDDVNERQFNGTAAGIDIYDPNYCGRACVSLDSGSTWSQKQIARGFYLQEELTFADRWILTLGGRYDDVYTGADAYSANDYAFTKRAGLTYRVRNDLSVYANYSESFQPPTSRNLIEGSPEPQEGTQYEVGMKYRPENTDAMFTLALFDLTQTNVTTTVDTNLYRQTGEVNVRGIELESKIAMSDRLNLIASYSYWDSEIKKDGLTGNEGNRPGLVPKHLASLWADYTIPGDASRGDLTLGLGTRFVSSSYVDDANTGKTGSHTLVDALINYRINQNLELSLNATNLFDREYISYVNDYSNAAFYGDSRAVRTTLRYLW